MTIGPTHPDQPDAGARDGGADRWPGARDARANTRPARLVRLLLGACALFVALDLALVFRVRTLGKRIESLTRVVEAGSRPALAPGEEFPALTLLDRDSQPVALLEPAASSGTLLFVSSASCDACESVRPGWGALAVRCAGSPLRVLELVIDARPAELHVTGAGCPTVACGGDAWTLVARMPGVPAAFLVDATGTVQHSFYGEEQRGLNEAVEQFLSP